MADKICNNKGADTPFLYQLAMFRAMQFKALKSSGKKNVEYRYWQERGWLQKDYYTNEKINVFKRIYSKILKSVMKRLINARLIISKEN